VDRSNRKISPYLAKFQIEGHRHRKTKERKFTDFYGGDSQTLSEGKEQNGDMVSFLKDDAKPLVDPSQYEVMKTNFALTKAMSDEELKGIEAYIYSAIK
jgi:hypothetical protein